MSKIEGGNYYEVLTDGEFFDSSEDTPSDVAVLTDGSFRNSRVEGACLPVRAEVADALARAVFQRLNQLIDQSNIGLPDTLDGSTGATESTKVSSAAHRHKFAWWLVPQLLKADLTPTAVSTAASLGGANTEKYALEDHCHNCLQRWVTPPATPTSPGTVGQQAFDGTYHYLCPVTNTWVRSTTVYAAWD